MSDYINKVAAILKFKYDIEHDVTYHLQDDIAELEKNDYTPRRTADWIARVILDLKD